MRHHWQETLQRKLQKRSEAASAVLRQEAKALENPNPSAPYLARLQRALHDHQLQQLPHVIQGFRPGRVPAQEPESVPAGWPHQNGVAGQQQPLQHQQGAQAARAASSSNVPFTRAAPDALARKAAHHQPQGGQLPAPFHSATSAACSEGLKFPAGAALPPPSNSWSSVSTAVGAAPACHLLEVAEKPAMQQVLPPLQLPSLQPLSRPSLHRPQQQQQQQQQQQRDVQRQGSPVDRQGQLLQSRQPPGAHGEHSVSASHSVPLPMTIQSRAEVREYAVLVVVSRAEVLLLSEPACTGTATLSH